ncbi:MAG: exodeoxyribonuclease VII small subunit [Bacteroidales bacterium]|nr:exodeoxyribonuclease VII small subunit [Bacteroidales bacterium]
MKKETGMTYPAARKELEMLVEELERPDADLGQISKKVKRALELVTFCREYLRKVRKDADTILDDFESA